MSLSKRSISGFPSSSGSGSSNINTTSNNKVTLGLLKGKAITTSVPTIKFSAGAEEVVEVFSSCYEEELATVSVAGSPKHERERSTTPVDCENTTATSTPASDPWRFFSGIKGKITKSVEGKLIEYKNKSATSSGASCAPDHDSAAAALSASNARSPKHHHKQTNNSSSAGNSRSDSEDISESSLSKTQGGLSTTEGVEMSSTDECEDDEEEDDGTPSQSQHSVATHLEDSTSKQTTAVNEQQAAATTTSGGLRYRLRTIRGGNITVGETTVGDSFLRALQRLAHPDNNKDHNNYADVRTEEGVDVLESMDADGAHSGHAMEPLVLNIENVTIRPDDVIEVREVLGSDIRASLQANLMTSNSHQSPNTIDSVVVDTCTIFNPTQFVDLRHLKGNVSTKNSSAAIRSYKIRKAICVTIVLLVAYFVLSPMSVYFSGFVLGVVCTLVLVRLRNKWLELTGCNNPPKSRNDSEDVTATSSIRRRQQTEGGTSDSSLETVWMNEWPAMYTPQTYSVAGTQPVHLRLQRHLLRVSNTNARLPKRDMQTDKDTNSATYSNTYSRHRIYDLRGATISLLPVGLTRIRWWSKKYPICVQLASPDQLTTQEATTNDSDQPVATSASDKHPQVFKQVVRKRRKWHQHNQHNTTSTVQFSKLMYDDNMTDKTDVGTTANMIDTLDLAVLVDGATSKVTDSKEKDLEIVETDDEHNVTRLHLFARTCRDKETWYQLLNSATCTPTVDSLASTAIYKNYMDTILSASQRFNNSPTTEGVVAEDIGTTNENLIWLNALIGRAWYSYATGGEGATMRLKERIQRKLATIRLPAFIEELRLSELSVSAPKMFQKVPIAIAWASHPLLDERGVWIDLDIEYESNVVLILQTKLNLMRLKSKGAAMERSECDAESCETEQRSAIFHSDVDDSAESSSDDDSGGDSEGAAAAAPVDGATESEGAAGATNQSPNHKLIRMVDRIADSRLFRAATEYRYVQRALENVRNTDLCLRVEVRSISGRVCINIPPPPSDRLWFGFRAIPEPPRLQLKALPTVGDYHISLQHVTGWLEKRLIREFHKVLVLPNMEDIVLPGLK